MTTSLKVVRIVPASVETVFDAWLDADAIRVWMCPGDIFESIATIDPRVGGKYEIVMRSPGKDDRHWGVYLEIDRPRRLSFTWCSQSTDSRETLVSIDLVPRGMTDCELTLVHSDLPESSVPGHLIGWKAHIRKLIEYLASDAELRRIARLYGSTND